MHKRTLDGYFHSNHLLFMAFPQQQKDCSYQMFREMFFHVKMKILGTVKLRTPYWPVPLVLTQLDLGSES